MAYYKHLKHGAKEAMEIYYQVSILSWVSENELCLPRAGEERR